MSSRTRIVFVTPSLSLGGAERVLQALVSGWDLERYAVSCCILGTPTTTQLELPGEVPITYLGRHSRSDFALIVARLRRHLTDSGARVVVSSMWTANVAAALAGFGRGQRYRLVLWEHIGPKQMFQDAGAIGRVKMGLLRRTYPMGDLIVTVSDGVRQQLINSFGIPAPKVVRIYNGIDLARVRWAAEAPVDDSWFRDSRPVFVSVGRLEDQKDFPTLLKAFTALRNDHAKLAIIGDGSRRRDLEALARSLGLGERCRFLGPRTNPFPYVARATAFVLASKFEGFALSIVEALSLGTPVIATDCNYGPREILVEGAGILVPVGDPTALAAAMDGLIDEPQERNRLSRTGRARSELFDSSRMIEEFRRQIERLAGDVVANGRCPTRGPG